MTLEEHLDRLAQVPTLLVASDYDGTLAPIVSDPAQAKPHRETIVALRTLAALPHTHVALISGRALRDLAALAGLPDEVHLVGSHGSEFDPDFADSLDPAVIRLRDRIRDELDEIARLGDGLFLEVKPASIAFHYRNAAQEIGARAVTAVMEGPATIEGVVTRHGKKVVELGVTATDKGDALETLRSRVGASAVLYLGDDQTDEDAFATLTGPDVGVKVGAGETRAGQRLDDPLQVARALARLALRRGEWLAGADAVPIEHHAMLSDLRTTALLTPRARITWLCAPRMDSPAVFAELLGGPAAGHFSVRPVDGGEPISQRYVGNTLIVETRWPDITVTDFLDVSAGRPSRRAGRTDLVRVIRGAGRVHIEFAPRLDYSRAPTRLILRDGDLVVAGSPDPVLLRAAGVEWRIEQDGVHEKATAELEPGDEPVTLELIHGGSSLRPQPSAGPLARLDSTRQWWESWASGLRLPDFETERVRHSAIILKGLCYGPTGAVAAAATTSLPEHIGGVRNWDYRFCWLRDAAMTVAVLVKLGSTTEAMQFLDWILDVMDACESPGQLRPLYTLDGQQVSAEAEVSELPGYAGSRPVRIGNAAGHQVQLDVFAPIVDVVGLLVEEHAPVSSAHWRLVKAMVQAVQERWHEPDHGIWEIRKPPRHHVHSKVMCWRTVDQALGIAQKFLDTDVPEWRALRDQIAADVLENGYDATFNTFKAAYDGSDLDAAALHVGLSGLLRPDDSRFAGTVEAVERNLLHGPVVYRYHADDGLPGFEGGFHLCTSWLIESYMLLGRDDDARRLFHRMARLAGPTGLLPEQYGAHTSRALGNTPQAYSHIGLIQNAIRLAGSAGSAP
ncbi:MAG: trehalose-phosphatase [Gemmatimonadetes bacterium]|nr:trehalose-phosphatase [Gemmatimonadota bacterium]